MTRRTDSLTLTNGVRIYAVPVSQALVRRVVMSIPEPSVPVVELDDGRREENPDDPDYCEAVDRCMADRMNAAFRAMIMLGCRIEELPDGFSALDDDGWRAELRAAGVPLPDDPDELKWTWWREYVLADDKADYPAAFGIALAATGILEPEVMRAVEWFQRRTSRGIDIALSATVQREIARHRN